MTESRQRPIHRILAVVALASLVGAVVVLFVGSVANLGPLVLLIVGLVVAVLGGWDSLTRRGMLRVVSLVVLLVGIGVLIAGLIIADFSLPRTTALLVLALLSAVSARFALGKGAPPNQAGQEAKRTSYLHPVLIMNLKSGGGKAERFHLEEECRHRNIEPIVLRPEDDMLQLAADAIGRGADIIGMAGGDGSQALVATVAIRHDVPLVVVPAGTRNHFALDLGLDRDDVVGALDAFANGIERRIDLASVNGRVFVNNATLGLYAEIVQSPEYRDAKRKTAMAMLPDLLGPDAPGAELRFTGPDGSAHSSADLVLVSNNPYELHRFAGRGTRARMDEGVLGVAIATIDSADDAAKFVSFELTGQLQRLPGWLEWTVGRFEVDAGGPVAIGVDGEALTMDPPLVFETMPGVLRVRIPRHAPGRSPAERAIHLVTRSTIVGLARVASGREVETVNGHQ